MKALICDSCHDLFGLGDEERACSCGQSAGRYMGVNEGKHKVLVSGPCRVWAIPNDLWYGLDQGGNVITVEEHVERNDGAVAAALRRAETEAGT